MGSVPTLTSLVAGRRHDGTGAREVRSPFDGALVARVVPASAEQVDAALTAAARGAAAMAALAAFERAEILTRAAQLLGERAERVARDLTLETGKPIRDARVEAERCATTLRLSAAEALRIDGQVLPLDVGRSGRGRLGIVKRFPAGVVTAITPFNFPLNLPAHKVGPALAAGNSVILKPAPRTPLAAEHLVGALLEAGCPPEALTLVHAEPPEIDALIEDPRVAVVSFTGSAAVGWQVKARASRKKVVLELGGNAAAVVHEDADVGRAVERCIAGSFSFAGQVCIRSQRILVHRSLWDRFLGAFLDRAAALRSGNPLEETTDLGPMIDEAAAVRAEAWIGEAAEAGARVLLGGKRAGSFLAPTVLTDVPRDCKAYAEEIFAPVVVLEAFDALEEAIDRVNDSKFGLQAGIFTNDIAAVMMAFDRLRVGGVVHDDVPMFRVESMPYGGVKDSGFGREGVRYAVEEMTEPRLLVLRTEP